MKMNKEMAKIAIDQLGEQCGPEVVILFAEERVEEAKSIVIKRMIELGVGAPKEEEDMEEIEMVVEAAKNHPVYLEYLENEEWSKDFNEFYKRLRDYNIKEVILSDSSIEEKISNFEASYEARKKEMEEFRRNF